MQRSLDFYANQTKASENKDADEEPMELGKKLHERPDRFGVGTNAETAVTSTTNSRAAMELLSVKVRSLK